MFARPAGCPEGSKLKTLFEETGRGASGACKKGRWPFYLLYAALRGARVEGGAAPRGVLMFNGFG
jgi:hypothetical protein